MKKEFFEVGELLFSVESTLGDKSSAYLKVLCPGLPWSIQATEKWKIREFARFLLEKAE